jgi:hypothetical protein
MSIARYGDMQPTLPHEHDKRSRAEREGTLAVIDQRLSPHAVKERAVGYAKDTAASLTKTMRRNPAATATAAIAAAALFVRRRRRAHARAEGARLVLEQLAAAIHARPVGLSRAGSAVADALARIGARAVGAGNSWSHVVGDTAARAHDMLSSEATRPVVEPAKQLLAAIEDRSRERPLLALGVALVTGALLCSILRR